MAQVRYTLEYLRALSVDKRKSLYDNATKHPGGQYIIDLIEQNGLPLSSGGLTLDDPVYMRIVEIAWSPEGKAAAIEATAKGIPALCAVDLLIQKDLGERYGKHDLGTASAGTVVAEVMRHLGYKEDGRGDCPAGCTTKTGMKWK